MLEIGVVVGRAAHVVVVVVVVCEGVGCGGLCAMMLVHDAGYRAEDGLTEGRYHTVMESARLPLITPLPVRLPQHIKAKERGLWRQVSL